MSAHDEERDEEGEGEVLSVHFGRAASCSSVGSVVDVLFLSTVAGAAVISALGVWLSREAGGVTDATPLEGRASETSRKTESETASETAKTETAETETAETETAKTETAKTETAETETAETETAETETAETETASETEKERSGG